MTSQMPSGSRINLESAIVMLIDDNRMSLDILNSAFMGFGVRERLRVDDVEEAIRMMRTRTIDLIVVDAGLPDEGVYDLMRWLRREAPEPLCFTPVVIVLGHTTRSGVVRARDSGANFVVTKPISAGTLLSRVVWIARERRPFLKGDAYCGPDRRFHNLGIPPGMDGRRAEDLSFEVGGAVDPNLSQNEVDMMMKPMKVDL
jgi:DNA-binding response OmpR family regulator